MNHKNTPVRKDRDDAGSAALLVLQEIPLLNFPGGQLHGILAEIQNLPGIYDLSV